MNPALLQALMQLMGGQSGGQAGGMHPALARALASQGRDGDTMLAHINPQEAKLLHEEGGRGTVNPSTGLPEFADTSIGGGPAMGGAVDTGVDSGIMSSGAQPDAAPGGAAPAPAGAGGAGGSGFMQAIANALSSKAGQGLKDVASAAPAIMSGGVGLINPLGGLLSALASGQPENAIPGVGLGKGLSDLISMGLGPPTGTAAASQTPQAGTDTGAVPPAGAIDPLLQAAMLYARG